jgi:eukaryotic-like serine/threonine-protein kinase
VKVLDFGVAKVEHLQGHDQADDSTVNRATFGTPAFMSPEQARGLRADQRSDVFSVGVLLYEMTTGQLPFTGGSVQETLHAVINEPHRPPDEINAEMTPGLAAVIDRALSKDAARRYQSAREMYIELQQLGDAGKQGVEGKRKQPQAHKWSRLAGPARRSIAVLAVAVAALTAAGAGTARLFERVPQMDSVAVLPFTNERADLNTDYLSDGLTESLISTLARLPRLRVMARSTMFTYQGRNLDPRAVGRELRVRVVLTGHVVQRGDRVIIGVEMVDVANGSRLWGQTYTRRLTELSALPADVANDVSRQMRPHVGEEEQQRFAARAVSGEAYQLYIKGRYFFNRRTGEGFKKAIEYFQQAIEKDARYALAYAGLADCYTQLGAYQILPPRESYPLARAAAEKALSLDESLAEAHTSLALVQMHAGESYRVYRRAHSERGWLRWPDPASTPPRCVSARSGWSLTMPPSIRRSGRRFDRSAKSLVSPRRRCGAGCARPSAMPAGVLASRPTSAPS